MLLLLNTKEQKYNLNIIGENKLYIKIYTHAYYL